MSSSEKKYFYSKRNSVWREKDVVFKRMNLMSGEDICEPKYRMEFEVKTLRRLYELKVRVPRVISYEDSVIAMEYIEGITLTEYIEENEKELTRFPVEDIIENLCNWFNCFYKAVPKGFIKGDVNCNNFLITANGDIVGLDFEEVCEGEIEADLGKLISFILTYNPEYTEFKKYFTESIYKRFSVLFKINSEIVEIVRKRELKDMEIRRKKLPQ